jgi:hypothetical protein
MPDQHSRAVLTRDKTRRGVLPLSPRHHAVESIGDCRPCDGCGQPIHPAAKLVIVTQPKWLPVWFHHECYRAWVAYIRQNPRPGC